MTREAESFYYKTGSSLPEDPKLASQEAEYMNMSKATMFASVDVQDLVAYIERHRQHKDGFNIQFQVRNLVENIFDFLIHCGRNKHDVYIYLYKKINKRICIHVYIFFYMHKR